MNGNAENAALSPEYKRWIAKRNKLPAVTDSLNADTVAIDPQVAAHRSTHPVQHILRFVAVLIAEHRIRNVRDELPEGDQILVKVVGIEGTKIKLSRRAVLRDQKQKQEQKG